LIAAERKTGRKGKKHARSQKRDARYGREKNDGCRGREDRKDREYN